MLFTVIILAVLALLYGYIAKQLFFAFSNEKKLRNAVLFYLGICWLSSPLPIVLRLSGIDSHWGDVLAWFVYLNMGFFSVLFVWYLSKDILSLFLKPARTWLEARFSIAPSAERRALMSKTMHMGLLGVSGSLTGIGIQQAVKNAVVREINVPIGSIPAPLKDLRIAQFTDVHIGPTIKRDFVENIVKQINQLRPDMIVMTGDLVDGSVAHLKNDVAPLAKLDAPYGKFFITGNHEYYSGAEAWIAEMKSLGFTVLLNEHQLIEYKGSRVLLAGVTDYRAHQYLPAHASSPAKAMKGAPVSDVKILLAHQPKSIFEASKAGFDFQISGHTHGGQYYPWNVIAKMVNPYIQGLHKHDHKTWIYVSPGTGYWGPPIRLGTEPEITMFRLS